MSWWNCFGLVWSAFRTIDLSSQLFLLVITMFGMFIHKYSWLHKHNSSNRGSKLQICINRVLVIECVYKLFQQKHLLFWYLLKTKKLLFNWFNYHVESKNIAPKYCNCTLFSWAFLELIKCDNSVSYLLAIVQCDTVIKYTEARNFN